MPLDLTRIGQNCQVSVDTTNDVILSRLHIRCGDNCRISIGNILTINTGVSVHMADNCSLIVGERFASNGWVNLHMHEPGVSIEIGNDCLFAISSVWTSDVHSVIDVETAMRINFAKSVRIGNHVWIAEEAMILKGVSIGDNSIIGAKSVVTRDVPANACAAGNPARVVRRGVTWDSRQLLPGQVLG